MGETILNLENEMNVLRECISDVDFCRRKVEMIDAETVIYKTNIKMNILAVLTSLFILACVLLKMNRILIGAGIALGACVLACWFVGEVSPKYKYFWPVNIGTIAAGILCFMVLGTDGKWYYGLVPVCLLAILQISAVLGQTGLKKRIRIIAKELDRNR